LIDKTTDAYKIRMEMERLFKEAIRA
ncbi:MAG: hypothetical protein RLZZ539_757, partial [Pseudomonadota bacterium]